MIVVGIIGLLAALAIPAFQRARTDSQVTVFVNNLQKAADSFELYAMEHGDYPPDASRGVVPAGMAPYLPKMDWTAPTPLGGVWDWEKDVLGIHAGISVVQSSATTGTFQAVDARIDDGNLATGRFRVIQADRCTYVIAE